MQLLLAGQGGPGGGPRRTATSTPFVHEGPLRAAKNTFFIREGPRRTATAVLQRLHLLSAEDAEDAEDAEGRGERQRQHLCPRRATKGREERQLQLQELQRQNGNGNTFCPRRATKGREEHLFGPRRGGKNTFCSRLRSWWWKTRNQVRNGPILPVGVLILSHFDSSS